MDLPALVVFNLVATHGGFGRASRASGKPKATLSRKVSELEASLGVRLIDRGSRTLRLTDEGRALHERTIGPLAEIGDRSEEHTSELQSHVNLVCRLLLEKKKLLSLAVV